MNLWEKLRARVAPAQPLQPDGGAAAQAARRVAEGDQLLAQGRLQEAQGQPQAAMGHYSAALAQDPDNVLLLYQLGTLQERLQRFDDAVRSYRAILRLEPSHAEVCERLVSVLVRMGRLDAAVEACGWALAIDPGSANAHHNLGVVLQEQGRWLEAHASYREALAIRPELDASREGAYACASLLGDWSRRSADQRALCDSVYGGGGAIRPFSLLGLEQSGVDHALLQLRAGRRYAELTLGPVLADSVPMPARAAVAQGRLRIGYLSADFHEHATMQLLRGVLAAHDHRQFKVHAYSYGLVKDGVTRQVQALCEAFRDLTGLSDADAARLIADDGIDLLIDLKGYTKGTRPAIQAQRPAPVCVAWLGYPGTLGHPALADYIIGDAIVTPLAHAAHFSETLALLPHCYQPNDRQRAVGEAPSRTQVGLPPEGLVFCNFNQVAKFNPESFDVWCRLLTEVPGSVLWLLSTSPAAVANLQREAQARGVAPSRLVFAPPVPPSTHLARLQLADLALDSFPYNSHTTGSDALWVGVPLVARMGNTFASRVAASLLHAVNLQELVTQDWDGYLALAKSLALDPPRLQALRRQLVETRAQLPLFDTERFTRDLERLYRRIWEQHGSGVRQPIILSGTGDEPGDALARASALVDQGNALTDAGISAQAEQCYLQALELAPNLARAHLNLGNLRLAMGDAQAALDGYGQALSFHPAYAAAHYNMGNANARLQRPRAAMACYRQALALQPDFADAEVALGNTLDDLLQHEPAAQSYRRALQLQPGYAQVHANLAGVLRKLGQLDAAALSCRCALELDPQLAEAHQVLGLVLQDLGQPEAAQRALRQAVAVRPDFGAALSRAFHGANQLCDWSQRDADTQALGGMLARGVAGIAPFDILSMEPADDQMALLQRQASLRFAEHTLSAYLGRVTAPTQPGERLRIGYLSADFHDHATMHLLQGVLAAHDRSRYAIHAYSYGPTEDAVTRRVAACCDVFRDLAASADDEAARAIASDGTDILVDLKGFTQHTRMALSAQRPAPVTVSWLGYPGTLGHPALADYIVGDPVVTPLEHAAHFSETLALMPHCYQPNDRQRVIGARPSREEEGLPASGFVFCSFNQSYKVTPGGLSVWCRLLHAVPGSVLWLLQSSPAASDNLRREAQAHGVAGDRLVFARVLSPERHLGRLQLADLALDTFPYNSHTTGSDALWAGVPLVTRMGDTFASRVAASMLHAVGLSELVTRDWEAYFALAKALANDPSRLVALRRKLLENRMNAPLFDTSGFTRDLERLYDRIWAQHARGVRQAIVMAPLPVAPGPVHP